MAIKRNVLAESGATVQAEDGTTMYATIQMRHGKESDMDKSKFVPAEIGITTDTKKVFVGFAPGDVEEMAKKKDIPDGTTNYEELENLPSIGGVKVKGNKSLEDYGIQPKGNYLTKVPEGYVTDEELKAELAKKLDKNQGAENAEKVLVVGGDGNVAPGETPIKVDSTLTQPGQAADAKTTGDRLESLAIKSSVSRESPLIIRDSAEWKIQNFAMQGKTEQVQTTGAQLFDEIFEIGGIDSETGENTNSSISAVIRSANYIPITPGESYTMTNGIASRYSKGRLYDSNKQFIGASIGWTTNNQEELIKTATAPENAYYFRFEVDLDNAQTGQDIIDGKYKYMFNSGSEALPYEPYTGGQPSPSPDYPQEIINAGKYNEETQKWEYEVKLQGKNLIPFPYMDGSSKTQNGITFAVQEDGGVKVNGTATSTTYFNFCEIDFGDITMAKGAPTNGKYVVSGSIENVEVRYNSDNNRTFAMVTNGTTVNNSIIYPQVEYGTDPTTYEPYRTPQTVLLKSDRPLTKWDRLEKRDGQWGWVFKSAEIEFDGSEDENWWISVKNNYQAFGFTKTDVAGTGGYCDKFIDNKAVASSSGNVIGVSCLTAQRIYVANGVSEELTEFKTWLQSNPLTVWYETAEETFVPLTDSEQAALNALTTYFPTTIISVDAGELAPEIEMEYVADTKTYIDNKFAELAQNLAEVFL